MGVRVGEYDPYSPKPKHFDPKPNENLKTGEIEVHCKKLEILNSADELPLELNESIESTEETRLKYRYLDLRKPRLQKNLELIPKQLLKLEKALNQACIELKEELQTLKK